MPTSTAITPRRRVSRETRQLLTAALVALVALWVLARIRFPDQPATPNPLPSLLSQLSPAPRFANLASEIADVQNRLSGAWLAIPASSQPNDVGLMVARTLPALRLRGDTAFTLLDGDNPLPDPDIIIAADRVTGLTVIRVEGDASSAVVTSWAPPNFDSPRYLMATSATPQGVSLRPVLVGSLHPTRSAAWSGPVWVVPSGTDLDTGTFVFTTDGELAGLVVREPAGLAIVPGDVAIADAERLLARGPTPVADLGVTVQPLTQTLAKATGARTGVVVAWVDPQGPATMRLRVGDVIDALNAAPVADVLDWEVLAGRLAPGGVTVRVRRRGNLRDVQLTLLAPVNPVPSASLGLTLRSLPGVGSTVVGVERGSAADRARLREGDVITLAGEVSAPTPADISAAFASAGTGDAVLLASTRGGAHRVLALVK